jgi:hypothetical protein
MEGAGAQLGGWGAQCGAWGVTRAHSAPRTHKRARIEPIEAASLATLPPRPFWQFLERENLQRGSGVREGLGTRLDVFA